jgi:hypothetical protein
MVCLSQATDEPMVAHNMPEPGSITQGADAVRVGARASAHSPADPRAAFRSLSHSATSATLSAH